MRLEAAPKGVLVEVEALLASLNLPTAGLRDQFPDGYSVVMDRGLVVGCAGLERYETVGLLRSVAVEPAYQRLGVGGLLVADRLRAAKSLGLAAVYLLTTTAPDYFGRWGFRPAERSRVPALLSVCPEFAGACPASAACLSLAL